MTVAITKNNRHFLDHNISQTPILEPLLYDQRHFPRWSIFNKAYYRLSGKHQIFLTRTIDLSLTGASLYVSSQTHPNDRLEMKIHVSTYRKFEAKGTVMWTSALSEDCSSAGIYFDHLSDETRGLILKYAFEFPLCRKNLKSFDASLVCEERRSS